MQELRGLLNSFSLIVKVLAPPSQYGAGMLNQPDSFHNPRRDMCLPSRVR
jgi:hypothetical protein